jgi:hypothetical protein
MSKLKPNRRASSKLSRRLGERVRVLRKRKDWSLEELAERAKMHVTYLRLPQSDLECFGGSRVSLGSQPIVIAQRDRGGQINGWSWNRF